MNNVDKVRNYVISQDNVLSYSELMTLCYSLIKEYRLGSQEHKDIRGELGELATHYTLREFCRLNPAIPCRILNSIILQKEHSSFTNEVDIIFVTPFCIFPLEVKSYYGNFTVDKEGKFVNTFNNFTSYPLAQNSAHCASIYNIIYRYLPGGDTSYIKGIVNLFGDCSIQDYRPINDRKSYPICTTLDLCTTISNNLNFNKPVLNVDVIASVLLSNNKGFTVEGRNQHIAKVKSISRNR